MACRKLNRDQTDNDNKVPSTADKTHTHNRKGRLRSAERYSPDLSVYKKMDFAGNSKRSDGHSSDFSVENIPNELDPVENSTYKK